MRITRVSESIGIEALKGLLTDDYETSSTDFANGVKGLLKSQPENCLILVAWDEENDVNAFIISYAPPSASCVLLLQAWQRDGEVGSLPSRLFFRLQMWADDLGRRVIHADTGRTPDEYFTSKGFVEVARVLEYKIPNDFELEVVSNGKDKSKSQESPKEGTSVSATSEEKAPASANSTGTGGAEVSGSPEGSGAAAG